MRRHRLLASLTLVLGSACGGGGGGGGGGDDGPDPDGPPLRAWVLHTSDLGCDGVLEPCLSTVVVLDLESRTTVATYPLSGVDGWALAVRQDGSEFFVVDRRTDTVRAYDAGGNPQGAVPVAFALTLALSPDEAYVYAVGGTQVVKIDAATMQQVDFVDLSPWQPNSVAVSSDGATLALAMGHDVVNAAVGLVTTSTMDSAGTATLTGSVPACSATPEAVAFTDAGTVLAWDGVCDELFEVDLAPVLEQVPGASRTVSGASGVYGFARHCLGFVDATSEGWVATEAPSLFLAPPPPAAADSLDALGVGGVPFFPRAATAGLVPYVVVALRVDFDYLRGGAVAIDALTREPVGEIAEFAVPSGAVLADLRVVPKPAP
jgi:hypothetical protein